MDGWDLALLVAASYVAVSSLVRLMRQRRDELTVDMRRQMDAEKRRRQDEERKTKQQARRDRQKAV